MHKQSRTGWVFGRLATLIWQKVGWQLDDLSVLVTQRGLTLQGHACTALVRALAEVEAARLSGLPVLENRIKVRARTARDCNRFTELSMSKMKSEGLRSAEQSGTPAEAADNVGGAGRRTIDRAEQLPAMKLGRKPGSRPRP
jgi:osmotically-inducible protein OsmY